MTIDGALLARLDALGAQIKLVCPIVGFSHSAGRIDPAPEATAQQIAAAQQLLATFDLTRPQPSEIKLEAQRRILARYPIHAQLNALARSTELMLQGQANWSAAEATEAAALLQMRAWIKSVRDVSNALEQSRPADFAADARWPE